nr:MAG TPA: hypothetical protein [Bacteriophage sp.]
MRAHHVARAERAFKGVPLQWYKLIFRTRNNVF